MSFYIQDFVFTELFLEMHCEKNEGGTQNLVLRGNDLYKKVGKRVTNGDLIVIIQFLRKHQEVVALDFAFNKISDCGMSILAAYMQERPVIRHLNLIGNEIGPRGVKYLAELQNIFPLYSLRLTGNKIGDEGGKLLSKILRGDIPLKFLDLSDTHQTMTGLAYVMTALMKSRGGSKRLEYIDLGKPLPQAFHQVPDGHAAEFVSQILHDNENLKEIHLQQYQFDFRDMEILLEGLFSNKSLMCLDLNNNNIGDDGVGYLCQYLKTSPPLECLMIGANNFSDVGALSLSFNIPFSNIKLLDVTNNRITDEGMLNIFFTIRKTVQMKALFLWGNKLTRKSLVVLHRLFQTGFLNPQYTDMTLHCAGKEFHASWNSQVNRYTHRFYCVSDFGHPTLRKLFLNPAPPMVKPPIYFKYHVDGKDMGFPMCEWDDGKLHPRYYDPI